MYQGELVETQGVGNLQVPKRVLHVWLLRRVGNQRVRKILEPHGFLVPLNTNTASQYEFEFCLPTQICRTEED